MKAGARSHVPLHRGRASSDGMVEGRARGFVAVESAQLLRGQLIQDAENVVLGIGHDARERGLDPGEARQVEGQSISPQASRFSGEHLDPTPSQDDGVHVRAESEVVKRRHLAHAGPECIRPLRTEP
jgi:hypothetical protein